MDEVVEIGADGSLRGFFRIAGKGLILIRPAKGPLGIPEQKAYVEIGRHLRQKGVSVPEIKAFHEETGEIWVEDVGDTSLFDIARQGGSHGTPDNSVAILYKLAVREAVTLGIEGRKGFNTAWCHDSPFYDGLFAAKREALYFTRFFLGRYAERPRDDALEGELIKFAKTIDEFRLEFVIHRDYQSRNLLITGSSLYVIDFQGAMIGPLFYDLAALLHDPYVVLDDGLKKRLFELYLEEIRARGVELDREKAEFQYMVLAFFRMLQVLGAYSFLTLERKRPFFQRFIPVALDRLETLLTDDMFRGLPTLKRVLASLKR